MSFEFTTPVAVNPGASFAPAPAAFSSTKAVGPGTSASAADEPVSHSAGGGVVATNTTETYEDNEGNRGQGPQAGDHDWHDRHMPEQVIAQNLPGVSDFDVGNDANDEIMAIATGPNTGPQQNAAPDSVLSQQPGPDGEPMPSNGVQFPISTPASISTSPGPQRSVAGMMTKDVHDRYPMNPPDVGRGSIPPNHAAGVMQAISAGAAAIGGGAGGSAGETPDDEFPKPIDSVPLPAPRYAFNPEGVVTPISERVGPGPRMNGATSPPGPNLAPQETY
jgi:hypothetical protein